MRVVLERAQLDRVERERDPFHAAKVPFHYEPNACFAVDENVQEVVRDLHDAAHTYFDAGDSSDRLAVLSVHTASSEGLVGRRARCLSWSLTVMAHLHGAAHSKRIDLGAVGANDGGERWARLISFVLLAVEDCRDRPSGRRGESPLGNLSFARVSFSRSLAFSPRTVFS